MRVPKLEETIAERWRGLKKSAADLAAQLRGLGPRGNRGREAESYHSRSLGSAPPC